MCLFALFFKFCCVLSMILRCFLSNIPLYVCVRLNAFFASRRVGFAVLNLDFFSNDDHWKTRTTLCYVSYSTCLGIDLMLLFGIYLTRLRRDRLGVRVRIDGWCFCSCRRIVEYDLALIQQDECCSFNIKFYCDILIDLERDFTVEFREHV